MICCKYYGGCMNKKYIVALIALCTCFLSLQSIAKESDEVKIKNQTDSIANKIEKGIISNQETIKGTIDEDITLKDFINIKLFVKNLNT